MLDTYFFFSLYFWPTICLSSMPSNGAYKLNQIFGHRFCVFLVLHTEASWGNQTNTVIITICADTAYAADIHVNSLSANCVFKQLSIVFPRYFYLHNIQIYVCIYAQCTVANFVLHVPHKIPYCSTYFFIEVFLQLEISYFLIHQANHFEILQKFPALQQCYRAAFDRQL